MRALPPLSARYRYRRSSSLTITHCRSSSLLLARASLIVQSPWVDVYLAHRGLLEYISHHPFFHTTHSSSTPGSWEGALRPLEAHNIRGPSEDIGSIEDPSDVVGANGRKRTKKQQAAANRCFRQGVMQVSWIWTSVGILGDDNDVGLNDALHVEWVKARAHALRWNEEVLLLKEEMRHTRTYIEWKAGCLLSEGIAVYAFCQAALHRKLSISFMRLWSASPTTNQVPASQSIIEDDEDVVIDDETYEDDAEDDMED
ncbi:uncharacterized protein F5147DRAFT_657762 [Suillus discolor]|uniref:Uncharacterized protein n=1 Tax=Suillus discolor TaxID=1912936 RepID=A0A9P7EWI1_9AGAM|nr:uncharacterized protein F5147DRAFT_657762 [Suillus discolor]KAG2092144.1 hypothetical protein F5147DRAFT_657762 [Suillus discolor]